MMNPARVCITCGKPVTGRSDKVFCSDFCKKEHHLAKVANQPTPPAAPTPLLSPIPSPSQPLARLTPRQERERRQEEHQHVEQLKKMDHQEHERERLHQLHLRQQPWLDERREMIAIILDHHRQCRQWSGQSTSDLPPADAIKSLADLTLFVRLPLPEPLPEPVALLATLPTRLIVNAKVLFKELTEQPSTQWAQRELSQALTSLTRLLNEVSQWQSTHPALALSEQPVYALSLALQAVVTTHVAALEEKFSWGGNPTIQLQLKPSLAGKLKAFLLS